MKAIILAAGKGERLKSITNVMPKPMIEYAGKSVLEHNIGLCKKFGFNEIYINLHHLPEVIIGKIGSGSQYDVNITYSHEDPILGTAGAVKKIASDLWKDTLQENESFLVVYGDTYSDYNIDLLLKKAAETGAPVVIGFHYREETQHSGVAEFSDDGKILRFIEKPRPGTSNSKWVNVGIYVLKPEILDYIPEGFSDFGKDIFPLLLEKQIQLYGVCDLKDVKVFDTPDMYNQSMGK